jgi:hypothetical protein
MNHDTGCQELRTAVLTQVRPKLHLFGHIHEARGSYFDEDTGIWFANCANAGFLGKLAHPPVKVLVELKNIPAAAQ